MVDVQSYAAISIAIGMTALLAKLFSVFHETQRNQKANVYMGGTVTSPFSLYPQNCTKNTRRHTERKRVFYTELGLKSLKIGFYVYHSLSLGRLSLTCLGILCQLAFRFLLLLEFALSPPRIIIELHFFFSRVQAPNI